jgi:hypothetical protein
LKIRNSLAFSNVTLSMKMQTRYCTQVTIKAS